jgi:hypothetical protein
MLIVLQHSIIPALALFGLAAAVPAGKPTGGPASTQVTIYSGPFACTDPNTPPPTDGSAGTSKVISVAENQCVIVNIPFGGAFTASMTATPKTGTTACYVQIFSQQGCGLTLQNRQSTPSVYPSVQHANPPP